MTEVMLKNVRVSYPSLWKKTSFDGNNPKYNAVFILDKVEHKGLIVKLEKMQKDEAENNNLKVKSDRWLLKDGDKAHEKALLEGKEKPELIGKMYLTAKNSIRPEVFNRKCEVITEEDGIINAGDYVNVIISLWNYSNKFGDGIGANLKQVQYYAEGDTLGGATVKSSINFEEYEDEF